MPKPPSLPKPRQQHKPPRQLHLAQCQLLPRPHSRAKAFCRSQAQLLARSAQPKKTAIQPRHPQQKTSNLPLLPLPRLLLPLPQAPHHHLRRSLRLVHYPRRISLPPVSLGVALLASAMSSPHRALLHHHGRCGSLRVSLQNNTETDILHNTGLFILRRAASASPAAKSEKRSEPYQILEVKLSSITRL